jgi:hypothetical protein
MNAEDRWQVGQLLLTIASLEYRIELLEERLKKLEKK